MKGISLLFFLLSMSCSQLQFVKGAPKDSPLVKNRELFTNCYLKSDSYQNIEKKAQGEMQIEYSVGPEGEVYNDRLIKSDFTEVEFHNCVMNEFRKIRFLDQKNSERLTQTLQFIQVKNEKL